METHETRRCIHSTQSRHARPPASRPIAARVHQGPSLRPLRGTGTRARAAVGRPHPPSALIWAYALPEDDMRPPWPCSIRCSAVCFNVDLQDAPAEGCERKGSGWQGGQGGRGRARAGGHSLRRAGGHTPSPRSHSRTEQEPLKSHRTLCVALEILLHQGSTGPSSASVKQNFAQKQSETEGNSSASLHSASLLQQNREGGMALSHSNTSSACRIYL